MVSHVSAPLIKPDQDIPIAVGFGSAAHRIADFLRSSIGQEELEVRKDRKGGNTYLDLLGAWLQAQLS